MFRSAGEESFLKGCAAMSTEQGTKCELFFEFLVFNPLTLLPSSCEIRPSILEIFSSPKDTGLD